MSDVWLSIVSIVLVALGVFAELNLVRIFVRDWRELRREERARSFRATAVDRQVPEPAARQSVRRRPAGPRGVAPFVLHALVGSVALAQNAGPNARPRTENRPGTLEQPAALCFSDPRPALSMQPSQPVTDSPPQAAPQPLVISTNRPSFTDTAGIVPIGHFQLETGYTFTFRNREGVETHTHNGPEALARVPILEDRLELQVGTSGYVWSRTDTAGDIDSVDGFSDLTVGLRWKVVDQDKWRPRIALQASTTTGAGTDGISNQDVEPTFKFIWSYDLGDGWGLYGNLGVAYAATSGERFVQGQAGACLSRTLNDKWSVYGEYYVFGPNSKGTDAAHVTDVGAAYLITPRIQLDVRIGFGLNQEANNLFTGAGISFLF